VAGAFLTALYTFRLLFIVFWGEPSPFVREHLHLQRFEGGIAMAWPVAVLTVLATIGGLLQIPGLWKAVDDWIHPVAESIEEASGVTFAFSLGASLAASLAGIALAWMLWGRVSPVPERTRRRYPWAARTLEEKFYFDTAYDYAFYEPSARTAAVGTEYVEEPVFLAPLGDLGRGVRSASGRLSAVQTGSVRSYALALAGGAAVIAIVFALTT
jgi:NADH-quinone oxidoreductase subunit L